MIRYGARSRYGLTICNRCYDGDPACAALTHPRKHPQLDCDICDGKLDIPKEVSHPFTAWAFEQFYELARDLGLPTNGWECRVEFTASLSQPGQARVTAFDLPLVDDDPWRFTAALKRAERDYGSATVIFEHEARAATLAWDSDIVSQNGLVDATFGLRWRRP